ncbi:sulfotransferase family 2 domain-containing protein [Celeribacter halophilus]|uniref:sulfotransferase family 2 domain-containing protein n=1 Tax=Celeribacter halophilus TaxID=576117 RepID=UPI0026E2CB4E|nr:sulfotransferase family 2 domain-containing protein [Celeribacter halophilus]MDO6724720.1 sulfotransferase family 2 domain-containing protein [Celeribacter halophilus]
MTTHRHRPGRALLAQLPIQHRLHDFWWSHKVKKRGVFTPWNVSTGVFFVHVPKCAGTSVYKSLGMPKPDSGSHIPIKAYFAENATQAAEMDSFTFVRNPWDRFVSAFHYLAFHANGEGDRSFSKAYFSERPDFQSFMSRFVSEGRYRRAVMSHPHFRPQSHYVYSANGRLKPKHIFRVEDGLEQLLLIDEKIGGGFTLESVNRSERAEYREYFNPDQAKALRRIYRQDVEMLEYEF